MPSDRLRTKEEIVSRLAGGDMTEGSCFSLALAYIGNCAGYEVLDFRGGESCAFFSSRQTAQRIAELPTARASVIKGFDDLACAARLLEEVEPGKEYCLATGQHAAMIRKNGEKTEYLELQHPSNGNGWHELSGEILESRFGCAHTHSFAFTNFLIEADSLFDCDEFLELLGYINTSENEQRKGVRGNVR